MRAARLLLLSAIALWGAPGGAAEVPPYSDIHENVMRVPVAASDLRGHHFRADIAVTTYRPDGAGPFPLVVISHGRAENPRERGAITRYRFASAAHFFVRKGFAVAVPTRIGYGDTVGVGDPENRGDGCKDSRTQLASGTAEIAGVVARLRREKWVDAKHLVLAGESVGGYITIAANSAGIPGLVASINFSGGSNGDPATSYGTPCGGAEMIAQAARAGRRHGPPMLWLYAENDGFFGPDFARGLHQAYVAAGGTAELRMLPPLGKEAENEGHNLFGLGNDLWQPIVDDFLARFGSTARGALRPVAPSHFARIDDATALPYAAPPRRHDVYLQFLALPPPRAFALSPDRWGGAQGDDAPSRALAVCQRESPTPCRLYAVDDAVVWAPPVATH